MPQLVGVARLGRDAELRHTPDGKAVAELSLAFSYGLKGQDGKKPTQWVKGSLWGARAESLVQYFTKGTQLYVVLDDAHIQTFHKKDGTQGTALAGKVSIFEFVGGQSQQSEQQRTAPPPQKQPPASSIADLGDDVPF